MEMVIVARVIERLGVVAAGFVCLIIGYMLFIKGVSGQASLVAAASGWRLRLLNGSPGLFLSLFGCIIFGMVAFNDVEIPNPIDPSKPISFLGAPLANLKDESLARPDEDLDTLVHHNAKLVERVQKGEKITQADLLEFATAAGRALWTIYEQDSLKMLDTRGETLNASERELRNYLRKKKSLKDSLSLDWSKK